MGTNGSKRSSQPFDSSDNDGGEDSLHGGDLSHTQKKRGWREIEAWRERKFLRESLAEIWDDDPLIDETVFSGTESDAAFYTESEDVEVEDELAEFDEDEAFYEDED